MKTIFKATVLFLLVINIQNTVADTHNHTIEYTLEFKRIGQVVASPDGKQGAFVVKQIHSSDGHKEWNYLLYLKNQNSEYKLIYKNTRPVLSPKWSPDGNKLAYVAPGKIFDSIWIYDLHNNKSYKNVEFKNDISSFQWSPDGKYFAFISNGRTPITTELKLVDVNENYVNSRLYIVSVNGVQKNIKAITPENINIARGFLLPGFDWSPDCKTIVFTYQTRPGMSDPYQSKIGFFNFDANRIISLPYSETHVVGQAAYSPNGQWIAFESNHSSLAEKKELRNNLYVNSQICVSNTKSFKTFCLANTFNEHAMILGWNKLSDSIFVADAYKTFGTRIYSLSINPLSPVKLISDVDGFIDLPTLTLNSNHTYFGFRYETFSSVPEAYISKASPFKLEKISHIQKSSKRLLGNIDIIHWKSHDNTEIEGLLITPFDYNSKRKYPLYVDVHGGPASSWAKRFVDGCDEHGEMFVPTSCTANLLGLGFVIFQPNPRGSDGYGKSFRIANVSDLGGGDYDDIMSGVDNLIQRNIADPNHLAIAGWSYGGYMTAWAVTQTNRFKIAIDGGGKSDMISFAGTTDMSWIQPQYLGAYFWDNTGLYLIHSPIYYVKNVNTPLLILHGENDQRVPIGQAYELYHALKEQNKTVKMLVSPKTGHAPTDPNIIASNIHEVDEWLKTAL